MKRMIITILIAVMFLASCVYCLHQSNESIQRAQKTKEQIAKAQEHIPQVGMRNGVEHRLKRK